MGMTLQETGEFGLIARVVATLGENDEVCACPGFPNDRALVEAGRFVTPHSVSADAVGNLFVVEWITGGRITKLARVK